MTYSFNASLGAIIRNADGKVVAPCESAVDPDFLVYQAWAEAGNQPATIDDVASNAPNIIPAGVFRDRFTEAEMDATLAAAYGGDAICRRLLLKLQTANEGIDLSGADTQGGVAYLRQIGVLTDERAAVVLG